jgi:hypothetical protein
MNTHTLAAPTFTRPADTTAYASGDLVANSTTAASVVALVFTNAARVLGNGYRVKRCRIRKSDNANVANAAFRLHLFSATPTFATNGDNDAISGNTSGAASWLGSLDVTAMIALADDAVGQGIPVSGQEVVVKPSSSLHLYGILEARGAYTPVSEETFTVTLEIEWL